MIDKTTGTIRAPKWDELLSAETTRSDFLASSLAEGAKVHVENEPWCSWNLKAVEIDDQKWLFTVFFHGQRITTVDIMACSPEFGTSWNDWSEEKEIARKACHDDILKKLLGDPPYEYDWGTVFSGYDAKGGFSSIAVGYPEKKG